MFNGFDYGYNQFGNNYVAPTQPYYGRAVPPLQTPQMPPQAQPQKPALQGMAWVNGLIGAQAYLIQPNTSILLMDSDSQSFYIKTSDPSGKADIRTFRYEEQLQNSEQAPSVAYVTKDEFEKFKSELFAKKGEEEKL